MPASHIETLVILGAGGDLTSRLLLPGLGSLLASNVDVYTSGWLDLSFPNGVLAASTEGNVFMGLPVTGFLVTNYVNAHAAPGILGNYSGLYRHHISRDVTSAVAE